MRRRSKILGLLIQSILWLVTISVAGIFFWVVGDIFLLGYEKLSLEFLLSPPRNGGREGGIAPMIVSTFLILLVCLVVTCPLSIGCAIFLNEYCFKGKRLDSIVRISLDLLAAMPSIVFGIFGSIFFCIWLKMGFSILAGGLTLTCMILPVVIRSTENSLGAIPDSYRHACAGLGLRKHRAIVKILLPMAAPGIAAGILIGLGRAMAETAALIFTSGYVDRMPQSLLDSGRALSIHIYDLSINLSGGDTSAAGTAIVYLIMLFTINMVVLCIIKFWKRHLI